MALQTLNLITFGLLFSLAWEDLKKREVSLVKIILMGIVSWLIALQTAGPDWSWLDSVWPGLTYALLLFLLKIGEKITGHFYVGAADLLVLAALSPQTGWWSSLFLACLSSCLCLVSMLCLQLLKKFWFLPGNSEQGCKARGSYRKNYQLNGGSRKADKSEKSQEKEKVVPNLTLPLLPFYLVVWLVLPLII